jgi:hypothetical protein
MEIDKLIKQATLHGKDDAVKKFIWTLANTKPITTDEVEWACILALVRN